MSIAVTIGTWHEKGRLITHCPSYYAADTETLDLQAGDYPARVTLEGGYTIPMPYWMLVAIDATRVNGRLYSGFGGVNFSHTELPAGAHVVYGIQGYAYDIPKLVEDGWLTLTPDWQWLAERQPGQSVTSHPNHIKDWDDPRIARGRAPVR